MNKGNKLIACGTSALFAAVLSLQAQTTGSAPSGSSMGSSTASTGASTNSSFQSNSPSTSASASSSGFQSAAPSGSATSSSFGSTATPSTYNSTSGTYGASAATPSTNGTNNAMSAAGTTNAANPATTSTSTYGQTSAGITYPGNTTTSPSTYAGGFTAGQNFSTSGVQTETQVTTFVQQLDTQGPAVVQQISTQVGDLACSQDTIQNLVDALHDGKSVTITANGQSSTFNASNAHLGYGEAYLALAMAAQQLRNAGVSTCATPEQWQAVLLGGPLNITNSSTTTNSYASASGSTQFPGIVTLHAQGQGWGQIAESNHIQLNQIVSSSNLSSNTNVNSQAPSPTGFSSAEMNHGRMNSDTNTKPAGEKKHHWWSKDKDNNSNTNPATTNPDTPANGTTSESSSGAAASTPSTR